jgi:hypothetical protein
MFGHPLCVRGGMGTGSGSGSGSGIGSGMGSGIGSSSAKTAMGIELNVLTLTEADIARFVAATVKRLSRSKLLVLLWPKHRVVANVVISMKRVDNFKSITFPKSLLRRFGRLSRGIRVITHVCHCPYAATVVVRVYNPLVYGGRCAP